MSWLTIITTLLGKPWFRYLVAVLLGASVTGWTGFKWHEKTQANAVNAVILKYTDREAQISKQYEKSLSTALEKSNALQADIETLNTTHAKELADAKAESDALRAAVADGTRRLSIRAVCPKGPASTGGVNLPQDPGTARVDDDAVQRVPIYAEDAANLAALAADADRLRIQLNALQDYISKVRAKYNE